MSRTDWRDRAIAAEARVAEWERELGAPPPTESRQSVSESTAQRGR